MSNGVRSVMGDLTLPSTSPPKAGEVTSKTTAAVAAVDVAAADLDVVSTRVAVAVGATTTLRPASSAKCVARKDIKHIAATRGLITLFQVLHRRASLMSPVRMGLT